MADNEARWYVVHTYSGYENKVASNLETTVENRNLGHLIQEIRVPTEKVTEIKDNKSREVERKVFPGYVIVKMIMNDDSWYIVRNIRGCTGFVGPSSKPVPLTDEEVERLGVEIKNVEVDYNVGDSVRIAWPTPKATFKNMGIVLLAIVIIGAFIFALDSGLYALLGLVMHVSN